MTSDNIEGIYKLTDARIKKLTNVELKEIFKHIEDSAAMVTAIQNKNWQLVANIIEVSTYQVMQAKCNLQLDNVPEMLKKQTT